MNPLVLLILDGWGIGPPGPGNAISLSHLEHIPKLWNSYPHTQLSAAGEAVGLPPNEDGNTETGHLNIGAGRVVYQDLPRINMAITDGTFFKNDAFIAAIRFAKQHSSNLHILGLLSDSGVHANRDHLYALLALVEKEAKDIPVYLHLFTDGRDSPPQAGGQFVAEVEDMCRRIGVGKIATIMGRYFAMDRDLRWDRTEKAYDSLTAIPLKTAASAKAAVNQAYAEKMTDEFIEPIGILDSSGHALPRIGTNDAVIFYNYRIDRPRQLTRAFVLPNFESEVPPPSFDPYAVKYYHKHIVEESDQSKPFIRKVVLANLFFVTMTEYDRHLPVTVAFPPQRVHNPIGKALSEENIRQLRVSETEKERFVGYYFNGQRGELYPGEDRMIIPSPKVATYDLKPEMSAWELTDKLLESLNLLVYTFVVVNFANPDMVAHTGNIPAAIKACEITDTCVGRIVRQVLALGGTCVITADHGNVEEMLGPDGSMDTEHSQYPVPFIIIDHMFEGYPQILPKGKLADIAPTILYQMRLRIPTEMTGKNLLVDMPML